jgi:signal transduction histidine kinase
MKNFFGRLSAKLLRLVIIINFVIIIIVVFIQILYRYNKEKTEINKHFDYVEKSYLPSISSELFKIDKEQLDLLINGILKLKYFEYAELTETSGLNNFKITHGHKLSARGIEKSFQINYKRTDGKLIRLGYLRIYAGYDSIFSQLKPDVLVLLLSSTLVIFLFSLLLLSIFQFLVSRHLINLANYAGNININNLTHDLVLKRKQKKHHDELDKVVSAINELEIRINQGIKEKEKASLALIKSEAQLSLIFNTVSDLIALLRVESNSLIIETVNECFISTLEKLGVTISLKDVLGKNFDKIATEKIHFSKEAVENMINKARFCINTGNNADYESIHKLPHDTLYLANRITPIISHDNKCTHILFVGRNITEQKISDKKLLNAIIKTEEKEKSRFAKEIHDGLGPILSTAKLYIQSLKDEKDIKARNETLKRVFSTLEEAIASIKEISNNLSPHILRNFGLVKAIHTFIEKISLTQNLKIDFNTNLKNRIDENIETTFYRVIIELLNNTSKHAGATHITIDLNKTGTNLDFVYTDNGKGFDVKKASEKHKGFGLFNMQNRFSTLSGYIEITSQPNKGIKVEGFLPLSGFDSDIK